MAKPGPKPNCPVNGIPRVISSRLSGYREATATPVIRRRWSEVLCDGALRKAADPSLWKRDWDPLDGRVDHSSSEYSAGLSYARPARSPRPSVMGIPGRMTLSPDYGQARMVSQPRQPPTDAEVEAVREEHTRDAAYRARRKRSAVLVQRSDGLVEALRTVST